MSDKDELVMVTCRGVRPDVLQRVKQAAFLAGVIPTPDGSTSDAVRWALVQMADQFGSNGQRTTDNGPS